MSRIAKLEQQLADMESLARALAEELGVTVKSEYDHESRRDRALALREQAESARSRALQLAERSDMAMERSATLRRSKMVCLSNDGPREIDPVPSNILPRHLRIA